MQKLGISFVAFAALTLATSAEAAPLSYSGGTYAQNFDGLPTNVSNASQVVSGKGPHEFTAVTGASGLTGWQFGNLGGSSSNTEFRSHDGSLGGSSGRGVLSHGTDGATDRALGIQVTSNQIPSYGLVLTNDLAYALTSFTLSYMGEQWRRGDDESAANTLSFSYRVGATAINSAGAFTNVPALAFVAPTNVGPTEVGLNGNLPANQSALSATISGINWAPGTTLAIRWSMNELPGQDDGLAIDSVSFSAVPEPSSLVLAIVGLVGSAGVVYRRRRAA